MNKEECIKEFVKEAQFYEQHYARIDIRFVTDFLNKHLEIYAEAKAKEATSLDDTKIKYYEDKIEMLIRTSAELEKEAYNQGVRDAAESVELHTPTTAPPKIGKWHSLPINKQSILKLLK